MTWTIDYYSEKVQDFVDCLPIGIRASYARLTDLLIEFGIDMSTVHCALAADG